MIMINTDNYDYNQNDDDNANGTDDDNKDEINVIYDVWWMARTVCYNIVHMFIKSASCTAPMVLTKWW